MTVDSARTFAIGAFTLSCASRTLVDEGGRRVRVSPQAFDALVFLVRHAGRVVSRDELKAALWPSTAVEDNSLNRVVLLLRRALGEGHVVTVKGRGYQLVAEVRALDASTASHVGRPAAEPGVGATSTRARVGLGAVGCAVLLVGAIAVLRDPAPSTPDAFTRFAEVPTSDERALHFYLSARSYESMRHDTDRDLVIRQYQRAVEEDPEFSLAWARLSIAHNEKFWFREDVSAARQQLARDAAMRAVALDPALPEARMALGWYYYHVEQDDTLAIAELERAVAGMPGDAEVHWRLGNVLRRYGETERAIAAFGRANALGPLVVDYLFSEAELSLFLRDYATAEKRLNQVLELFPDQIGSLTSSVMLPLYRSGDVSAVEAAATDPRFETASSWAPPQPVLGWTASIYQREYGRALEYLDAWEDASSSADHHFASRDGLYGLTYELGGRPEKARPHWRAALAHVEGVLDQNPGFPEARIARAEALVRLGRSGEAVEEARRVIGGFGEVGDRMSEAHHRLAAVLRVFLPAGLRAEALAELDAYLGGDGFWSLEGLMGDPRLDPIRDDPGFAALVAKYRRR